VSIIARCWISFAAIGAGLIHLSLAIGAPTLLAVALGSLGFVEFGWGAVTIAQPRLRAPRVTFAAAMTPVIAWGVALIASGLFDSTQLAASLPLAPLAIAALLELTVAFGVAAQLRRERSARTPVDGEFAPRPPARPTGRAVLGVVAAAAVTIALTLVALAATPAGLRGFSPPGSTPPPFDLQEHPSH
jgi:hypothetical protein